MLYSVGELEVGVAQSLGDTRFEPNFCPNDQSFVRRARWQINRCAQGLRIDNYINVACAVKAGRRRRQYKIRAAWLSSIFGRSN
jgi:hypothetical protein